ncbi:hypothetical protein CSKR_104307 [Clonorchis sinensis]|uniref:Kinase D-interacting substrate of 220 kDa-like SAM domain-containing protein n=1 Tax=Clonorchis sinensis TaxID=79923 RepID=A0A419Q125_CLOSI|nr:hypothetical protein CSKR_104307 [Clonorchis sinensis]
MSSTVLSDVPPNKRVFSCRPETNMPFEQQSTTRRQLDKNDLETVLELGVYHYPLELHTPDVRNHGANTVRALADMFTCRMTHFPLTVGIFNQQNKNDHLSDLASELHNINSLMDPTTLKFNPLLFLFPLFISTTLGYLIGMVSSWQVGLSIGHLAMFIQIIFLVVIITGSRIFQKTFAIRLSHKVAEFLLWLRLVLNVCFCYPTQQLDKKSSVRTIVVYHRLFPSSTPTVALFSILDKMWTGLIRLHGEIPIRLLRASPVPREPRHRYKRVCCLPAFLVVIVFWIAFIVGTAVLRDNSGQLKMLLSRAAIMITFVAMSSIMFLTILGSLPSIYRLIRGLAVSPIKPLRTALADFLSDETSSSAAGTTVGLASAGEDVDQLLNKIKPDFQKNRRGTVNEGVQLGTSTSLKNLAISAEEERARRADIRIKEEFGKLCRLSLTFDSFLGEQQTRFIMCLDASETNQRDVLAKLIYQIHSLVLTDVNAPVAFVLEADFKVLLGEVAAGAIFHPTNAYPAASSAQLARVVSKTLNDNLHLVRTSIQLPIYLDTPVCSDVEHCEAPCITHPRQQPQLNSIITSPNGYSQTSPNYVTSFCEAENQPGFAPFRRSTDTTYTPRALFANRTSVPISPKSSGKSIGLPLKVKKLSFTRSSSTTSRAAECSAGIAGLFIQDDNPLADWNRKTSKQLVAAMAFTSRFLRLCNLDIPMDDVVFWISLVHYWPYHMAWLVLNIEEHTRGELPRTVSSNDALVNLEACLHQVKSSIGETLELLEPLMADDRSLERLESYIKSNPSLPLMTLKKLTSCVLMHNPYLLQCIRALAGNASVSIHTKDEILFYPPIGSGLPALIEEQDTGEKIGRSKTRGDGRSPTTMYGLMERTSSNKSTPIFLREMTNSTDSADKVFTNPMWEQTGATEPSFNQTGPQLAKALHQFSVIDVCNLLANLPNLPLDRLRRYQNNVRHHHISGAALLASDLEKVRRELAMECEDWQNFSAILAHLKSRVKSHQNSDIFGNGLADTIPSTLIVKNKYLYPSSRKRLGMKHHTATATPPHSSIGSELSTSQQNMVRQTPWLLSPQVPTGPGNADGHVGTLTESILPSAFPVDNGENQTSLSGMEEPESLWKPAGPPVINMNNTISEIIVNAPVQSGQFPRHDMENSMKFSPRLRSHRMAFEQKSRMNDEQNRSKNASASMRPEGVGNQRFTSRSTVDLRTVLGPLSDDFELEDLHHLKTHHGRRKVRPRRFKRDSDTFRPVFTSGGHLFQGQASVLSNLPLLSTYNLTVSPNHSPISPNAQWRSETETLADENADLRRMRKRPCRRPVYYNECGTSRSNWYPVHPLEPESNMLGQNETVDPHLRPASKKFREKTIEYRAHKVFHPPALTPAQLASLKSYVEMSERMNTMIPRPDNPPVYQNMVPYNENLATLPFWASYFQTQLPPSHSIFPTERTDFYRPSHKKRPRTTTNPKPSSSHSISQQTSTVFPLEPNIPIDPSVESDHEECTCDYWYGIDRTGGKVAISEPTLHENSCELSSFEESPDEVHTLSCSLGKSNTGSFDWEDAEMKACCK